MKTKIFSLFTSVCFLAAFAACDDHHYGPEVQDLGQLSFDGFAVGVDESQVIVESRAIDETVDVSDYIVTVVDKQNRTVLKKSYSELPEVVDLNVGEYSVKVESHEVQPAEFDNPYYAATKDVKIEKNKITDIGEIVCKFASIRVSVTYAEELRQVIGDDFKARVCLDDAGTELTFTPSETRSAFFKAADLTTEHTLIVNLSGTVNGQSVDGKRFTFDHIMAGEHHIIRIKTKTGGEAGDESGSVNISDQIGIDHSIGNGGAVNGDVPADEPVLGSDDRPGQEDPETPDQPGPDEPVDPQPSDNDVNMTTPPAGGGLNKLEFGVPTPATDPATVSGVVNITADSGLAHLYLQIESTDEEFAGIALSMFGEGRYDFAYPTPGSEDSLEQLHLSYGDAILNKTVVEFDISTFIPMLAGFKGTHTFNLTVVSNNGSELSKSLIFIAE